MSAITVVDLKPVMDASHLARSMLSMARRVQCGRWIGGMRLLHEIREVVIPIQLR
jgi:hypothetical protein